MNLRLLILLLLLLKVSAFGQGYDGRSLTGTNIWVYTNSTFWRTYGLAEYNPGITNNTVSDPIVFFHDQTAVGDSNITMLVTLPETLSANVWKIQFKCIVYDQTAEPKKAIWTLGDGVGIGWISDRDNSSSRWMPSGVLVTNTYATNQLHLELVSTNNTQVKLMALYLYYTTNIFEDIDAQGFDIIWNYAYPTNISTQVDNTNNILPAASFESGLGGWTPDMPNKIFYLSSWLASGDAQHGNWAMKIADATSYVVSPYFYPKSDGRNYTLSLSYKAGSGSVRIKTLYSAPAGYSNVVDSTLTLPTSAAWTRTNLTLRLLDYPVRMPYIIRLTGTSNTLFDAIQLTEGTNLAPFRTMGNLEVGWSNSVISGVYYTNESSKPYIVVYNSSGTTRDVTIHYEFCNHFNTTVLTGSFTASMADGARVVQAITLPSGTGWFRAQCWADGVQPKEAIFTCMPDPGSSQSDLMGTHLIGNVWQVKGMERTGISHTRALSDGALFRWTIAEPTEGNFVWFDTYVTNTSYNNMVTLAPLMNDFPGWAATNVGSVYYTNINLTKVSNFVYAVVSHYKDWVHEWEVGNEMSVALSVAYYTNILKEVSRAARAADPTARIMGLGGPSSATAPWAWATSILQAFGSDLTNWVNSLSIHGYPSDTDPYSAGDPIAQGTFWKTNLVDVYGPGTSHNLQISNTEAGYPCWYGAQNDLFGYPVVGGGIFKYAHQRPYYIGYIITPSRMAAHSLTYKAYGFEHMYYYDSRNGDDSTWIVNAYSSWEKDEGHRPKFAGQAIVNYVVAGTTGGGRLPFSNTNVAFMFFENGNNSRAAVWTTDASHYTMTSTNITPYDWMLVPKTVTANQFTIGRMPTYLLPDGLTSAQFQQNITNSGLVAVADTFPPQLSICMFPGSAIEDTNRVYFRVSCIDEYSVPSPIKEEVLLTRFALIANSATIDETNYTAWATTIDHTFLNTGTDVTFYAQGKDEAGNVTTQTRMFGESAEAPDPIVNTGNRGRSLLIGSP